MIIINGFLKIMKLKSPEIKNILLRWSLSGNGLIACTEPQFNNSDVFSINKNYYSTEIEIKTAMGDLLGELKIIKDVIENPNKFYCSPKGIKHTKLLINNKMPHKKYITRENKTTNYFSFCVTEELEEKTKSFIIDFKLPYGLLIARKRHRDYYYSGKDTLFLDTVIKSKRLIKDKCPQHIIEKVARRACWETYNLRLEAY